jgi:SLT domain-containing protein
MYFFNFFFIFPFHDTISICLILQNNKRGEKKGKNWGREGGRGGQNIRYKSEGEKEKRQGVYTRKETQEHRGQTVFQTRPKQKKNKKTNQTNPQDKCIPQTKEISTALSTTMIAFVSP